MIGLPFNDHGCLGALAQVVAQMVDDEEPAIVEMAERFPTEAQLKKYIQSQYQIDDLGQPDGNPAIAACSPPQRFRVGDVDGPNCFERTGTYAGVMQFISPHDVIQFATLDTPLGLHTFPLKNGWPVVLDPRVSEECLECGLALAKEGPVAVEPKKALAWTVDMAEQGVKKTRNGASQVYVGRNAIRRLVDEAALPSTREIDSMGVLFALAERAAARYGARALAIVRTAARAIADVLDGVLERRNAHLNIGGLRFDTPKWLDDVAGAVGNVGVDVGSVVLRSKLEALDLPSLIGLPGSTSSIVGLFENELNQKGRTLDRFAHPPQLATFSKFADSRAG